MMAKLRRFTGPGTAQVLSMNSSEQICEYQSPAPSMVAALIWSGAPMVKLPCGIPTDSWAALAAVIGFWKAAVESVAPVGSAPSATTEIECLGWDSGAATS